MMLNIFFLSLLLVSGVDAFLVGTFPAPAASVAQNIVIMNAPIAGTDKAKAGALSIRVATPTSASCLLAKTKKQVAISERGKGARDPLRWISPGNPYMWFVYFFAFIIAVPPLKEAGIL